MKTGHGYRPFCQAFYHQRQLHQQQKKGNNISRQGVREI